MIIKSKEIVEKIKEEQNKFFVDFELQNNRKAKLYIVKVGTNKISESYIRIKNKYAQSVNVEIVEKFYDENISEEELITHIEQINLSCDGVIVQLPLPLSINKENILGKIDISKDIDLLNPDFDASIFMQPVVFAIMQILNHFDINLQDENKYRNVILLGNGKLVGQPVSNYLNSQNINHIVLDKDNSIEEVSEYLLEADIIVSGLGIANFVKPEMIKEGVILIDAGTSEDGDSIIGDIDRHCADKVSIFSSTPGGVGPLTVCGLFENLRLSLENKINI
jgi:methylenetetrahydrofolate dehydrogenase (NADP+) / methenyltetrahydrofolate cyclohydrolase